METDGTDTNVRQPQCHLQCYNFFVFCRCSCHANKHDKCDMTSWLRSLPRVMGRGWKVNVFACCFVFKGTNTDTRCLNGSRPRSACLFA